MKRVNYSMFREDSVMDFCGEENEYFSCINENHVRKSRMKEQTIALRENWISKTINSS